MLPRLSTGKKIDAFDSRSGLTLVELLTAIAIFAILALSLNGIFGKVLNKAAQTREANAGRQLILAYHLAAKNDRGTFLAGRDRTISEVQWPDGTLASGPIAYRYPFRLGPYYDFRLDGVILVNENAEQISRSDTYAVSLSPAFGINYIFVGGDRASDGTIRFPDEVITRPAHTENVLVFATAGRGHNSNLIHGHNILTPPNIHSPMWGSHGADPQTDPNAYGNVHARHGGKAICAFLDGSVRRLSVEELRDMRLWSRRAAQYNDPHYRVPAPASGGGRR